LVGIARRRADDEPSQSARDQEICPRIEPPARRTEVSKASSRTTPRLKRPPSKNGSGEKVKGAPSRPRPVGPPTCCPGSARRPALRHLRAAATLLASVVYAAISLAGASFRGSCAGE